MQHPIEEKQRLERYRENAKKGQECYEKALSLESTDPLQAVKLLYQAYLTSSHHQTRIRLINLPAETTELIAEKLNLEGVLEDIFYRALQYLMGIGVNRSYQTALAYLDYVIQAGIQKNDTAFVPPA